MPRSRAWPTKWAGLKLKLTHKHEGKTLRRKGGGDAHAKQFPRLKRVVKRQRTILGSVLREVRRKMVALPRNAQLKLEVWLQRAERIHSQCTHERNKLYALHAPLVGCIGKGKARKPYEFGEKVIVVVTHKQGFMAGARSFPGNPYDGHTLAQPLEQTRILLEGIGVKPMAAVVGLGFGGVDEELAPVELILRGKSKTVTQTQRRWLRRRRAIEPTIGHAELDHRTDRRWLAGQQGDALHAVLCAAG